MWSGTAVQRLHAAQGMAAAAVCVMRVMAMWCDLQQLDLRKNPRHETSSL